MNASQTIVSAALPFRITAAWPNVEMLVLGRLAFGQARASRFVFFQLLAKVLWPLELYRDSVHGGVVGLKSYLTVVESHDAANISMLRLNIGSGMLRLSSCMLMKVRH